MRIKDIESYGINYGTKSADSGHKVSDFKVGDRVICIAPQSDNNHCIGTAGIVEAVGISNVGVEFSEYINGHRGLKGECKAGYGYIVRPRYLVFEEEILDESLPDKITTSFDALFGA